MKLLHLLFGLYFVAPVSYGITMKNHTKSKAVITMNSSDWWFAHIKIVDGRDLDAKFLDDLKPAITVDVDIRVDSTVYEGAVKHWHFSCSTDSQFDLSYDEQQHWFVLTVNDHFVA